MTRGSSMKKFVYPAVFYYDNATKLYCAAIKDLAIFIDGETVEDAHNSASELLKVFISTSLKYEDDIPEPTSFEEFVGKHPQNLVMLVECEIN